jgi:hypothetical protein
MKNPGLAVCTAALTLVLAAPVFSQDVIFQGQGQAVVTVLPKHEGEVPPSVANQDLSVKVNGKVAKVTKWAPFGGDEAKVELVLLIDGSARNSLGRQMDDMEHFIKSLPPNTKAAVGYMDHGRALLSSPLSADHAQVARGIHLPGGLPGSDSSPYFCLSDLAKSWPSNDADARREVVMVTDGVDNFQHGFDPEDPYVEAAIRDSIRARLIVYSIYWKSQGRGDQLASGSAIGQNFLSEVSQATGGKAFWQGMGNPVSFEPIFDELTRRLRNQYELRFNSALGGKPAVETFRLKLSAPGTEVDAPGEVMVMPAPPASAPGR